MKKLLAAVLMLIGTNVYAQQSEEFELLATLTGGTWQMKNDKGVIIGETWTQTNGKELKGRGYSVTGKDTTTLENITIAQRGDQIFYVVQQPGEQQSVYFKLTDNSSKRFIFQNPENDFPQRIVYQFGKDDEVHARIDGYKDGKRARQDYRFKRVYNKN